MSIFALNLVAGELFSILLACAYLRDKKGVNENDVVIVCPIDSYVEDDYYCSLKELEKLATNSSKLVIMGVEPDKPNDKYGYIMPEYNGRVSKVQKFIEKPGLKTAAELIAKDSLWNTGVFAFKINYILDFAQQKFRVQTYDEIISKYDLLPNCSFDKTVVENEQDLMMLRFDGKWRDIGTWDDFADVVYSDLIGKAQAIDCTNTNVINSLNIPLLAVGLDNLIAVATNQGILVLKKNHFCSFENINTNQLPMFGTKEWGKFEILNQTKLDDTIVSTTMHLTINKGKIIKFDRDSKLIDLHVILGNGKLLTNGNANKTLKVGDSLKINTEIECSIFANTEMELIQIKIDCDL